MEKIGLLRNSVKTYAWGSRVFIPSLLGEPSPSELPQAELWMGAHPEGPSSVLHEGQWMFLPVVIGKAPGAALGTTIAERYANQLPFLFKILAADKPLSIQAHPSRDQALEGFRREDRLRIPLEAPHRNYKDTNHKPEILCALTPFAALKGFRKAEEILQLMSPMAIPVLRDALGAIKARPGPHGLKEFFRSLMTMDRERQGDMVDMVVTFCDQHSRGEGAHEWVIKLHRSYPRNIGVIAPLFLNLIHLAPKDAVGIEAGILHTYLEGAGIELMANSDNVLRGGLTGKHVDVPELLRILRFQEDDPQIWRPEYGGPCEGVYPTSSGEFRLSVIQTHEGGIYQSPSVRGPEIVIALEGDALIRDTGSGDILQLKRGTSVFIPAAVRQYFIEGTVSLYKAAVPLG